MRRFLRVAFGDTILKIKQPSDGRTLQEEYGIRASQKDEGKQPWLGGKPIFAVIV
jgi:hypothetical protein